MTGLIRRNWTGWSGRIDSLTVGDVTTTLFPGAQNAMVVTDFDFQIQSLIGPKLAASLAPLSIFRGNDVITGTADGERIDAGRGKDVISAGAGDDTLLGNTGNDRLLGETGNDRLFGGGGADRLLGGVGNDAMEGGKGDDVLDGGSGRDTMNGGEGRDVFVFRAGGPDDIVRVFENGLDKFSVVGFDPDNFDLNVTVNDGRATVEMDGDHVHRARRDRADHRHRRFYGVLICHFGSARPEWQSESPSGCTHLVPD